LSLADEGKPWRFLDRKIDAAFARKSLDLGSEFRVQREIAAGDDYRLPAGGGRDGKAQHAVATARIFQDGEDSSDNGCIGYPDSHLQARSPGEVG
jgi:hypothetical protein